ncbi:hypothetical protein TNIN_265781, partial [Trichonephila inaurata madagascariensis]
ISKREKRTDDRQGMDNSETKLLLGNQMKKCMDVQLKWCRSPEFGSTLVSDTSGKIKSACISTVLHSLKS